MSIKWGMSFKGVYQSTTYSNNDNKEYIDLTRVLFKTRYNQHKYSINLGK